MPFLACLEANKARSDSFEGIVREYMQAIHRLRELQMRNAQLERESEELRVEAAELVDMANQARLNASAVAELEETKSRAASLQEELLGAYRDRTAATAARETAQRQLEVVREINERQSLELETALADARELKQQVARLTAARDLAAQEAEARNRQLQEARDRAVDLDRENQDLVQRFLELKDSEMQRMDGMNNLRDEMIQEAKRKIAEMYATARSSLARQQQTTSTTSTTATQGILDVTMHQLDRALEESSAAAAVAAPTAVTKCVAGVHVGGCHALAFDPTGRLLATCGSDKVVQLWDLSKGHESKHALRGSHEGLNDVAFTCDSRFVLGAEDQNAVRLWDTSKDGRLANVALTGHSDKVTGVATSPTDPGVAYTYSRDRTIKIWRLSSGVCEGTIMHPSGSYRVSVLPDTGLLVTAHFDGALRFWDPRKSGKSMPAHEVAGVHAGKGVLSAAVAPIGRWVLSCGRDNTLCLLDTRTFSAVARLSAPTFVPVGPWATPALSPFASHAAAGADKGSLFVWDISSITGSGRGGGGGSSGGHSQRGGKSASFSNQQASPPTSPSSFAAAAAGSRHSTTGVQAPSVLRQPKSATREQHEAAVMVAAWSPAGLPLVTGDRRGGVTFWG